MGGLPRVAAIGLRRPANSNFDVEYAERTQTCRAETEALCDKIDYHHETNDKEKTKVIKNAEEKVDMIMFQDIRAFAKVYSEAMMFIKHEVRILMAGLEAEGKTTVLYKLKLREDVNTIPTVGFKVETVEYENIDVTVRDVVGQDQICPPWRLYHQNAQGFIVVIGTNDRDRIEGTHEDMRFEDRRVG